MRERPSYKHVARYAISRWMGWMVIEVQLNVQWTISTLSHFLLQSLNIYQQLSVPLMTGNSALLNKSCPADHLWCHVMAAIQYLRLIPVAFEPIRDFSKNPCFRKKYSMQTRTEGDWARSNSAYKESSPKIHLHDFNIIQIGEQKYMSIPANWYYQCHICKWH